MGVPKFFRYFSERYPCVITSHDGEAPMHFDNLYLDMNGIIHHCSHNNDVDLSKESASSDEMARAMCVYIEKLFDVVRPRKNFLMCVDGVAPRAKMNQQRQRRFRKETDTLEAVQTAKEEGREVIDPEQVFDSNEITPGTPFMDEFSKHFKYFIARKLETDESWRGVNVVFSGYDAPGEGEHKIMDFIRKRRMSAGYDPNEKHCLYGLDADLIMLALVSHEPHFVLLREVVKFESKKDVEKREELKKKGIEKESLPVADQFVLFHVETFRNYLSIDFAQQDHKMIKAFDWAPCYNDFVVMCFFVGNDFLPGIPTLNIHEGVMAKMFEIYNKDLLQKGMFLTKGKRLNWEAIRIFLRRLGEKELEMVKAREKEEEDYNKRQKRYNPEVVLKAVSHTTNMTEAKEKYYKKKFDWGMDHTAGLRQLCLKWVEGIEWVWKYYVDGVPSWRWFYPFHYSPFASDLAEVNLLDIAGKTQFELNQPFLPFDQLLGVLPPMSIKRCLPVAYHKLPEMEALSYAFPKALTVDRENARAPWEGVVVIPFLDEHDILKESAKVRDTLTHEERIRNTNGTSILYKYDPEQPVVTVPSTISGCPTASCPMLVTEYISPSGDQHNPVPLAGAVSGGAVGFSALFSKHFSTYMKQEITIFDKKSFKESVIIKLEKAGNIERYREYIHKWVWVDWPHYRYARINAVMDKKTVLRKKGALNNNAEEARAFDTLANEHRVKLLTKRGIAVDVSVMVSVKFCAGVCSIKNELHKKMAAPPEALFPVQLIKLDDKREPQWNPLPFPMLDAAARSESRNERSLLHLPVMYFPHNRTSEDKWGCVGEIVSMKENKANITLKAARPCPQLPHDLSAAIDTSSWVTLKDIAHGIGVPPRVLELLCGSITTTKPFGAREIGMCLVVKSEEKMYSRLGCAKYRLEGMRTPVDTSHYMTMGTKDCVLTRLADRAAGSSHMELGCWIVSSETRKVIETFCKKFNPMIEASQTQSINSFDPQHLRTGAWEKHNASVIINEIEAWVKAQPHWQAPLVGATEDMVPPAQIAKLEQALIHAVQEDEPDIKMRVHKQLQDVYTPFFHTKDHMLLTQPGKFETKELIRLGARVINMKAVGAIPFGARGVVVRMLSDSATAEVVLDDEFLGATTLNGRLSSYRGALIKKACLMPVRCNTGAPKAILKSPQKSTMHIAGGGKEPTEIDVKSKTRALDVTPPPSAPSPPDNTMKLPAEVADALGVASIGAKKEHVRSHHHHHLGINSPDSHVSPPPMSPQMGHEPGEISLMTIRVLQAPPTMAKEIPFVQDMRQGFKKKMLKRKAQKKPSA
eukprot:TRINITY_DN5362_c0_g1_i1.p1 TRINITY_DN5362_c0_g1~~TRINITY_DN5362_c0_g1_i1.p1  ORF type:complete len:1314 (+),score=375.55 TRINITY_DN5362_c0_g1_i1:72-4013(+)